MFVECRALAFCANIASALPLKHGDEPCTVVHAVSSIISGKGEGILAVLQHHLQEGLPDDPVEGGQAAAQVRTALQGGSTLSGIARTVMTVRPNMQGRSQWVADCCRCAEAAAHRACQIHHSFYAGFRAWSQGLCEFGPACPGLVPAP